MTFATFAYYRIRGAIFDGMRAMGWYSRGDYARYRAEERANEYMASAAEREAARKTANPSATKSDSARALEDIAHILSGVATVHITSIEGAWEIPDDRLRRPMRNCKIGRGAPACARPWPGCLKKNVA